MKRITRVRWMALCAACLIVAALAGCGSSDSLGPDDNDDNGGPDVQYSDVTILPEGADYGPYFPVHKTGDCDFGLNGPQVRASAEATVDATRKKLIMKFAMIATETAGDATKASGSWSEAIYEAPEGWFIDRVLGQQHAEVTYIDTDLLWDVDEQALCTFRMIGSTLLHDVCNTVLGDATRMEIRVNPFAIRLRNS